MAALQRAAHIAELLIYDSQELDDRIRVRFPPNMRFMSLMRVDAQPRDSATVRNETVPAYMFDRFPLLPKGE